VSATSVFPTIKLPTVKLFETFAFCPTFKLLNWWSDFGESDPNDILLLSHKIID
jgi:hypothetical protein